MRTYHELIVFAAADLAAESRSSAGVSERRMRKTTDTERELHAVAALSESTAWAVGNSFVENLVQTLPAWTPAQRSSGALHGSHVVVEC